MCFGKVTFCIIIYAKNHGIKQLLIDVWCSVEQPSAAVVMWSWQRNINTMAMRTKWIF